MYYNGRRQPCDLESFPNPRFRAQLRGCLRSLARTLPERTENVVRPECLTTGPDSEGETLLHAPLRHRQFPLRPYSMSEFTGFRGF
jgi:hypothetical protein